MRPIDYCIGGIAVVVVVVLVAVIYMDFKMTEQRLQTLPPPTPKPTTVPTPSPTPTPAPSVRVIYAIPLDRVYDARYERAIRNALRDIQRWYADQLGGITFAISGTLPQVCFTKEEASYFAGVDGWDRVIDAVQHCDPVEHFSDWHTWVVYIDAGIPCENAETFELGRGGDGVAILDAAELESIIAPKTYRECGRWWLIWPDARWEGGVAHELGHAFGLLHPPECNASPGTCKDESLMWNGYVYYPETFLRDEDAAFLTEMLSRHPR